MTCRSIFNFKSNKSQMLFLFFSQNMTTIPPPHCTFYHFPHPHTRTLALTCYLFLSIKPSPDGSWVDLAACLPAAAYPLYSSHRDRKGHFSIISSLHMKPAFCSLLMSWLACVDGLFPAYSYYERKTDKNRADIFGHTGPCFTPLFVCDPHLCPTVEGLTLQW